jgi:hypothetical protein
MVVIPPDSLYLIWNVGKVEVSQHYFSSVGVGEMLGEEARGGESPGVSIWWHNRCPEVPIA